MLWELDLPKPDPAYDHQYRMCADVTYAPVAAGGLLFVPSNVSDEVSAYELDTGHLRWRFPVEGPVRMAPVCVGDDVCFGSDDGLLYSLEAKTGSLRWKIRGAPEDRPDLRLLINGRFASRWPVRGAPVVHQGTLYFGAGIWPEEGVYVCAVEAATGKLLWRRDDMSYVNLGMSDHGAAYDLSLPPQGYLALIDDRLAVPSGRSLAAWFDPATGVMEPYTCFYVKTNPPRGTWYLAGVGHYCVQGGNWFGTRSEAKPPLPPELEAARSPLYWSKTATANESHVIRNRPFLNADIIRLHNENGYTEPVLTPTTLYQSEFSEEQKYLVPRGHTQVSFPAHDRIVARDLTRSTWKGELYSHVAEGRKKVSVPRLEFPLLWELNSSLNVLIKAGDLLFAGGAGKIAAVAIPKPGSKPRILWEAQVCGTPVHALVADGKLVVVTEQGKVNCFGPGGTAAPSSTKNSASVASEANANSNPAPPVPYALVLGWGDGSGAESLAVQEKCRVIVLEPDSQKAIAARLTLAQKGLHGRQVQILGGAAQLTPYWASQVRTGSADAPFSEPTWTTALDALRPFTGEMRLKGNAVALQDAKHHLKNRSGYEFVEQSGELIVRRPAPLPGSADWTHESGGPGNCFASNDELVKWPLGVLWYSGDIDRFFTPATHFQHERNPYPLVIDGRMFVITGDRIHCIDIYTGSYLWRAEMPLTPYVKARFFDSRYYGRPTERNCVVGKDWIYVVTGAQIQAYDVVTGALRRVIEIPEPLKTEAHSSVHESVKIRVQGESGSVQGIPEWTEVRLWNDCLLAMLGPYLAAVDRHTGELRWSRRTTLATTTCALGDGLLFGLDCALQKPRGEPTKKLIGRLFALDPAKGTVRWEREVDFPPAASGRPPEQERPWLEPMIPVLAHNSKNRLLVLAANRNGLRAFHTSDGSLAWSGPPASQRDPLRVYSPVVTDDYVVLSDYQGAFGYLLDVRTGKEAGENRAIPRPRTCARIIGNNHLLVYRDSTTEIYDIERNRMIGLNSLRSGCTTSFIPAGGIITAPMFGHGCVCNYPMFSSVALFHMPGMEPHRPNAVVKSWVNQGKTLFAGVSSPVDDKGEDMDRAADAKTGVQIDLAPFALENAGLESRGNRILFQTKDTSTGYAIRAADRPLAKAVFQFSVQRAQPSAGEKRHGNAFFVFSPTARPEDRIECRIYYGGRSSFSIAGKAVAAAEEHARFARDGTLDVTVSADCDAGTISCQVGEQTLKTKMTAKINAISHYGFGGANSANLFSAIDVK